MSRAANLEFTWIMFVDVPSKHTDATVMNLFASSSQVFLMTIVHIFFVDGVNLFKDSCMITLCRTYYHKAKKFDRKVWRGGGGKFGESSVIHQTKTNQISTYNK